MHSAPAVATDLTSTPGDLGPVLIEQKGTHGIAWVYTVCGVVFVVLGAGIALISPPGAPAGRDDTPIIIAGACMALFGALYLVAGTVRFWRYRGFALFLHERGIRELRAGQEWRIPFKDAVELRFQSTRYYINGAYGGTVEHLGIRTADPRQKPVYFQRKIQEQTGLATGYIQASEVQRIADTVAASIAARMADQLNLGRTVDWTPRMKIHRDGVEVARLPLKQCEASDLVRRWSPIAKYRTPPWRFIPWEKIELAEIQQGVFRLWVEGEKKPLGLVLVGLPNFHPGYFLVATILKSGAAKVLSSEQQRVAAARLEASLNDPRQTMVFRFTWTAFDHVIQQLQINRSTPEGRAEWRGRIGIPIACLAVLAVIGFCAEFLRHEIGARDLALRLAATAATSVALVPVLAVFARWLDRKRIVKDLKGAQALADRGEGRSPFSEYEFTLSPLGYRYRVNDGQRLRSWTEISRIEMFEGYVFFHVAGDKLEPESVEMLIPPRVFEGELAAHTAFERIREWHRSAGPKEAL